MNLPLAANVQLFESERRNALADLLMRSIASEDRAKEALSALIGEPDAKKQPDDK